MSTLLANRYTVRRIPGPHLVNGRPVRSLRDDRYNEILITDDGDPDEFLERTVEAVVDGLAAVDTDGIEVIAGPFPAAPLISDSEAPRLPYGRL